MDKLIAARKQYAELQELVKKASNDPEARRALEQKLSEGAAQQRRKAQGPGQTAAQDSSQAKRAQSQAQRNQGRPYEPAAVRPAPPPPPKSDSDFSGAFLGLDPESFRKAFIIKEILSPPPSLRDDF